MPTGLEAAERHMMGGAPFARRAASARHRRRVGHRRGDRRSLRRVRRGRAVTVHERGADATLSAVPVLGRRAEAVRADFLAFGEGGRAALVAEVEAELGVVDILVNNAGIIRRADAARFREADWDAVMAVNLKARLLL